jgi:ABC transport system ATP-binding/permease protein
MNQCPNCGTINNNEALFCNKCGKALTGQPPAQATDKTMFSTPEVLEKVAAIPEFVVYEVGGSEQKYALSKPVMQVGRASDNDIVIKSLLISRHHLIVETHEGKVTIKDLSSTNGTQVNGVRIPPNQFQKIQPGDVIRIGDLIGNSIRITVGSNVGGANRSQSMGKLDLSKLATQDNLLVGRDASCDLWLPHLTISQRHALFLRQNGQVTIRDLKSKNGTFVNGARIEQVILREGDEIQIGPFRLVYDSRLQNVAGSRLLGHRLDALHLVKLVKGGKKILNDVNLSIQSSEFVALVGGSGAGKSTLLRALNGYDQATGGNMLIDGSDFYGRLDMYRPEMGYVPQDDIIHRQLPVGLALWYAAKLRLPDAGKAEINKSIEDALVAVEMADHVNTRVGDLSGGQRKRVSIASELLAQPTLFFLDEPTSGLDPGLEKKMMYDLNRLADQGRTVVLVTHATSNIEQCNYVAFMAQGGRLAYYGPPKEAISFFNAQDFADIYQKLSLDIDPVRGKNPPVELQSDYQQYLDAIPAQQQLQGSNVKGTKGGTSTGRISAGILWARRFQKSPIYQKYIVDRQANLAAGARGNVVGEGKPKKRTRVSFIRQAWILARRNFDLIRHDMRTMIILLAMLPLIALLFAAVSHPRDLIAGYETPSGVVYGKDNITSALKADLQGQALNATNKYMPYTAASMLLAMLGLALTQGGTFGAAYEIVKERPIFKRERAVNLSVWSYVLSKVLVLSLFAIVQVAGVLLMISLKVKLGVTGIPGLGSGITEIFITLYLAVLASIAFGLFISAIVPSTDVVMYVILAQLFVQIVLSGTLFPLPKNPASYLTPGYWTTDALGSIVDLPGLDRSAISCKMVEIPSMTGGASTRDAKCDSALSGVKSLENYEYSKDHLLTAWIALGIHVVVWLLLTVIVQTYKKSGKD